MEEQNRSETKQDKLNEVEHEAESMPSGNEAQKFLQKHRSEWLYFIFGFGTTFVSWSSYAIFVGLFNMPVAWGNILSWVCAVLFAFFTNKVFVFESKSFKRSVVVPEFTVFMGTRLLTGVLEMVGVPFLVDIGFSYSLFGAKGMWAKIVMSVFIVVLNYILSKKYVFKERS